MLLLAMLCVAPASAQTHYQQETLNREYAVKAAYLYNFLNYVEWPGDAAGAANVPFVIGVFQSNPFGRALDTVARTKTVASRPIEIRQLHSIDQLQVCHILFVPNSVPRSTEDAIIGAARGTHVLTVGESPGFVERGGAVQFYLDENKVRFAFNSDVVDGKNFKISSKLLSLAKIIPTH
jgi:hypothetical protein